MARDAPFTHRDDKLVVPLFISPNFAVLLENAFDELSVTLMSRDNRIKVVRLMLSNSLPHSGNAEYTVVITFNAKISAESARFLAREVSRWKNESLKAAMKWGHEKSGRATPDSQV